MARQFVHRNFDKGLITSVEDFSIPEEAASDSLNWLTLGDHIELTGGYTVIGTEQTGSGKITGLHVGQNIGGSEQAFVTFARKIKYYDESTEDWVEIGTNTLPEDAEGEDMSFTQYNSQAGAQTWLSSPNSDYYKIMTANPGTAVAHYASNGNIRGYLLAENGRMFVWNNKGNPNTLLLSYIDQQLIGTQYTQISSEAVGSSGSTDYTGTIASVSGVRTFHKFVFTDGTQTVQDDGDGNLVGDGSGTVNYATGAYDVTFDATTTGAVTVDYQYEDATDAGLANFSFSATRAAGEGAVLYQPTGGDLEAVHPYGTDFYCLHEKNVWLFSMPASDLIPSNQVFRQNVGMPNWKAAVATGEGIYFVDTSNEAEPKFRLLTLGSTNDQVTPQEASLSLDLTGYKFDKSVADTWGDYVLIACRTKNSTNNNRLFAFNRRWQAYDILDYAITTMAEKDGQLWAGDSLTNNVYQLFTGFDANNANITNYWEGKLTQLEIDEIKKFKRLTVRGNIALPQRVRVSLSYDGADFQSVGIIESDGAYVDTTETATLGSPQIGSGLVGGETSVSAFPYIREFRVRSQRFDEVKIRFEALNTGYVSVSRIDWYDIKLYGQKNIIAKRQTA